MKNYINVKNIINYITGFLLLISFLSCVVSGYIVWFVLPRGTGLHGVDFCNKGGLGASGNLEVFDLPRYIWIDVHNWISIGLVLIIILHLAFHWRWLIEIIKRTQRHIIIPIRKITEQYLVTVILFLAFVIEYLSGFIIWLVLPRGSLDYHFMIAGYGRTFCGLQRNIWVDIHAWVAVIIISIIIIHLSVNWRWIIALTNNIMSVLTHTFTREENNNRRA
ncbi:MAG: DUF4405 domain-containing protein [Eubacteriales bacterium]